MRTSWIEIGARLLTILTAGALSVDRDVLRLKTIQVIRNWPANSTSGLGHCRLPWGLYILMLGFIGITRDDSLSEHVWKRFHVALS